MKLNPEIDIYETYISGATMAECAKKFNLTPSMVQRKLKAAGIARTHKEAGTLMASKDRCYRRKVGEFTMPESGKKKLSEAAFDRADKSAAGIRVKTDGYIEFTRGPNKGRSVHIISMENRLGRRIYSDECVHHIDGDVSNNEDNNLALVTRSGHSRLHRYEDKLSGNERARTKDGRFS